MISEKPFLTNSAEWICVTPQLKMAPLSTYMLRPHCFQVTLMNFSRGEVKRAERIGERGEPWGVLWSKAMGSDLNPLKDSRTCRSDRKDCTHVQRFGAKPRLRNIWTIRSMLILLKNPEMSKRMTEATKWHLTAAWAWCMRQRAASVAQW